MLSEKWQLNIFVSRGERLDGNKNKTLPEREARIQAIFNVAQTRRGNNVSTRSWGQKSMVAVVEASFQIFTMKAGL